MKDFCPIPTKTQNPIGFYNKQCRFRSNSSLWIIIYNLDSFTFIQAIDDDTTLHKDEKQYPGPRHFEVFAQVLILVRQKFKVAE